MMWLRNLFARAAKRLTPKPDQSDQLRESRERERWLTDQLAALAQQEAVRDADRAFHSLVDELVEAQAMAGAGPWRVTPQAVAASEAMKTRLREAQQEGKILVPEDLASSAGAYGDIELQLMTIDWRREINFSALQFRSEERRVGKEGRSRWSPYH